MTCRLLLSDVHDIATKVGQEFQRLIEAYGCSSVSTIIPTVVEALEHLESYVEEYQKLQTQNFKLILENDSLAAARERRGKLDEDKEVRKSCEMMPFHGPCMAGGGSCAFRFP